MSAFYHVSSGRAYGPSEPGESLRDYKARQSRLACRKTFLNAIVLHA